MPLARSSPMKRTGPLRRTQMKAYRPKPTVNPDAETTLLVIARATVNGMMCCEVCGNPVIGERGLDWALHHRRGRDGRPDSHSPQNTVVVHGADNVTACHGRIHRNRAGESRTNGWLISRNAIQRDPLQIAVLLHGESLWAYLTADGRVSLHPPQALG